MFAWFRRIGECLDLLGTKLADYMKCSSNCCNNINIYTPKNCAIMGSNRWLRTASPVCLKKDESFYTPKN